MPAAHRLLRALGVRPLLVRLARLARPPSRPLPSRDAGVKNLSPKAAIVAAFILPGTLPSYRCPVARPPRILSAPGRCAPARRIPCALADSGFLTRNA